MCNSEIEAAIKEQCEKHHAVDTDLIVVGLDWSKGGDLTGAALKSFVKKRIDEIRLERPHLFRVQNAAKMTDAEFGALEAELRKPQQSEPVNMPGWIREIDAVDLNESESIALRAVLTGSRDSYSRSILESVARRQNIDVAPTAA